MQYNAGCRLYCQAWLGDFGLAEVYEHSSNTREVTIPPAGRMGYLAPEYVYSAVPTEKTYVYSFGVVVLEVATGRRPVDDDGTVVVDWVWDLREKGKKRPRMLKDRILYQRIREQRSGLLLLLAFLLPHVDSKPSPSPACSLSALFWLTAYLY
ncbi:hypothetical protein POPTR_007G062462v4 [Populus trichocarpa]|jgi:hypothetical protein|uniref:Uncharacterized protein n=6 Tax=Populus TaxID=3689 RepID=A0ACC0SPV9_POPTR|nr:hypothetical protein [Populus davidiana]YP_009560671.1 hypothetical protein [Populus alba]ALP00632.1 hypothetical protein [Populus tremula]ALP46564.1 hypothetical protein [Populus tremula x Populus alba]KAI5582028.1 hypothetical protein BDE02_07G058100 [Populus trichocarpa]QTG40202.1 hypothetical protein [Populus rotundifolia var. duclouxiana]UZA66027.1 hypothetical protein Podel.00MG000012 [Populus deltoides]